jgi:hypothetical protein
MPVRLCAGVPPTPAQHWEQGERGRHSHGLKGAHGIAGACHTALVSWVRGRLRPHATPPHGECAGVPPCTQRLGAQASRSAHSAWVRGRLARIAAWVRRHRARPHSPGRRGASRPHSPWVRGRPARMQRYAPSCGKQRRQGASIPGRRASCYTRDDIRRARLAVRNVTRNAIPRVMTTLIAAHLYERVSL